MKNIYFIFSLLLLASCSKNEPVNPDVELLPSKSITSHNNGEFFGSKVFTYNDNMLTKVSFSNAENENAGYAELQYSNQLLVRIDQFDKDGNLKEYLELSYDSDNNLEEYTIYKNAQNRAFKNIVAYGSNNSINVSTFTGDFETQTEESGEVAYTLDANGNIIKIQTAQYQIDYEYDSKNGIFKNLVARDVLNLIGRLHGALNRGGMNNAISYEFSNNQVTDHIDLNYTYNEMAFPNLSVEVSPEFGEGMHTEYIYN